MSYKILPTGSVVIGSLPRGCALCQRGRKSVLFITGLCSRNCFYCPISRERRGRDLVFINEARASSYKDIIAEVVASASLGIGITGGEPLLVLKRTVKVAKLLKRVFGPEFHIHLYTGVTKAQRRTFKLLRRAGIDEIRFHVFASEVSVVEEALGIDGLSVGVEVPALPGEPESLVALAHALDEMGADFLNINELEFSETNAAELRKRGYSLSEDYVSAIGSREAALEAINKIASSSLKIAVHFCLVRVKNLFQTGLRLYRRGVTLARPYEMVTDEGTVVFLEVREEECPVRPPVHAVAGSQVLMHPLLLPEGISCTIVECLADAPRTRLNETPT